ncbi:A-kinase anchor protein 11 isoform X2 [Xenopus laevis]|uniref:A-kinase anchor protein 11 isoform X2 n=1 Tax=Xenopus laevis TaxID=8355 RepID=A0A8J0UIZ3_XENLA|nr:A-kinase anchor protein 11 isoform X2 [Xenopus laevis]
MATCTRKQGCQTKPKLSVRKENISDAFLISLKSVLESKKQLCRITEGLKGIKKENVVELTFLGLSEGSEPLRDVEALHWDLPELLRSLHLCTLNDCEVILLKDGKEGTSSATQGCFSGTMCVMSSPTIPYLKRDSLFNLMSKYTTGIKYTVDHHLSDPLRKASHSEEDDTNQSVSSIEDDFVTAFEHLDEEDLVTSGNQERDHEIMRSQRDAASQTQPTHCKDIRGSKIIFSSLRRRSSLKSATLMGLMGFPDLSASVKNTVTSSVCDSWKQMSFSVQDKTVFTPPSAESSESECSSPSPIIFLDEEGYQKSLRAKLNLPKIPVVKDDIEDSDSELSEFFDSFDQFDETESSLESNEKPAQKNALASPPKKRKCVSMNPQKFKADSIILSANVKKPTPRKPESPYNNISKVSDSHRPVKATVEDSATLFNPIRSSAFSPLGISTHAECLYTLEGNEHASEKDRVYSDYANCVCFQLFDSVLNTKPPINDELSKKGVEKSTRLKRKSYNKESERKLKSKQKKGGIQKFASELVEKSLGGAFKDLQRGVSSCTSALCQLAARLTSYVFQMAFYEIRRMQAFSIKKQAINSLANLMVSEVITSALQELRYIKKQMVTNAVTRFATDLAEELVFEGIMEVCQFSHPPTPVAAPWQTFDYDNAIVSSYAKDLSESVIQEAFIELSQVNVTFTTQAAISVSMDTLKYVNSESMMQSTQRSGTFPNLPSRIQSEHDTDSDYTVQHALLFTSGLISSVPVPVAAKALTFYKISNEDCAAVSVHHDMNSNTVDCYSLSTKYGHEIPTTKTTLPLFGYSISNSQQEKQNLPFKKLKEDNENVKAFSVSMVDMMVNEAYDVISSAKKVVPSQNIFLDKEQSKLNFADGLAKCILHHSIGESSCTISDRCMPPKLKSDFVDASADKDSHASEDTEICTSLQKNAEQQLLFTKYNLPQNASASQKGAFSKSICVGNSDVSEVRSSERNVQSRDTSYSSIFGLQTCLSHINNFSSVMCSCGDDFSEDKTSQRDSSMTTVPDTPPPTPLASYELSPERSMKKLCKELKGQLAKEFYPATPPSTPRLSDSEHDSMKKEDFLLKVMRSLSEEVETSSSDGNSEDFYEDIEVSEDTSQYADYLSTNILSVATEMAADVLDDKSVHRSSAKNRSLLPDLSDKWGYPAYMRNVSEETLAMLCKYAGIIAGEVLNDAKKVVVKKQNTKVKSVCDVDCCHCRKHPRDCRPKEKGCICTSMNFKESDPSTLSLPHNNIAAGLTSKYPSCESVTEEYADHIIRVLKMEGGNNELIIDQYAGRLVYRAVKSGLQQASKTIKLKCNRKPAPRRNSEANSMQEILRLLSMTQHQEREKQRRKSIPNHSFGEESSGHGKDSRRPEFTGLLRFAETLANTITCDVRRKLKISAVSLPKSLTDSCLYTKSKTDEATGDLVRRNVSKSLLPYSQTNKLYHSTGSLNDESLKVGVRQAIEQYACKVVDSTIEFTLETARLQTFEHRKNNDKVSHTGKPMHSYGPICRVCSAKEQGHTPLSCHFLLGPDVSRRTKQCSRSKHNNGHKSRIFHHNIPKIHIDFDKRAIFAEKIASAAIEKAERELSNTSLAADSGIGQDGSSFADSLTTEIMMYAMKNIGHVVNQSSDGKDGFQSADSVTSQQTSVSVGDDSNGSWSNLSFEDEHQDESSSFLHLSDSDGAEDKDENHEAAAKAPEHLCKTLLIRNVDMGPYIIESQLRTTLQWIVASEVGVSELYFVEGDKRELLAVSRRLAEKAWTVGDLLQAVVHYCEITEKLPSFHKPLFGWLLDHS